MKVSTLTDIGDFGLKGGPYWHKANFMPGRITADITRANNVFAIFVIAQFSTVHLS